MNPKNLFSLTARQREDYQIQPDGFPRYDWEAVTEEYEIPPYIPQTFMRFWYNTENTCYSTHWHDALEMIVPLEAPYTVVAQDVTYTLEPGDILIIPPGILHSIIAPKSGTRFIFLHELSVFVQLTEFTRTQSLLSRPIHITSDTCPEIYETEIKLLMQAASCYFGSSCAKQLHIYSCLMEFYACYTDYCTEQNTRTTKASGSLSPKDYSRKLTLLLEYMKQHFNEDISLEDAASKAGLSKFYFSRIFKQYTGQTFYDYLSFLRIQAAEALLKDTTTPVSAIALACGYSNISSFNRSFRKFQKCTPSQYRSLHRSPRHVSL